MTKEVKKIVCKTHKQWRNWLAKNHEKKERIMLVRYKRHTGKPTFNQREAMNEAICFGWIDTTINRIDQNKYGVNFVKRKKTSRWSSNTIARAKEMIKQGKMSEFGMKMYELGLKRPVHDSGNLRNPAMPEELLKELDKKKNKKAKENFERLASSYRRTYLVWIISAKLPETKKKRIKQTIEMVGKNLKPGTLKKVQTISKIQK